LAELFPDLVFEWEWVIEDGTHGEEVFNESVEVEETIKEEVPAVVGSGKFVVTFKK
jgi:hypothetical protein